MAGTGELTDYLEMQEAPDFVTKTELRSALRERGLSLSDRNLTYYTSLGLVPSAVRVGGRTGAYPRVVIEQAAWVIHARDRGQSLDSIRDLLPLWRWLMRSRHARTVDLAELELVARRRNLSQEANYAIPYLMSEVFQCLCTDCLHQIEWVLKDGTTFHHSADAPLLLSFVLASVNDETGKPEVLAWTQLQFSGLGHPDPGDPASITLGLPVGVSLSPSAARDAARCRTSRRRPKRYQEEVLPLT